MSRNQAFYTGLLLLPLLFVACAPPPGGQGGDEVAGVAAVAACPGPIFNQDLIQPRIIRPTAAGEITTSLYVQEQKHSCIPVWVSQDEQGNPVDNPQWQWREMTLRTYGSPQDGNNPLDPVRQWTIPGPTFRVWQEILPDPTRPPSASNKPVSPGTRFQLLLANQLPNNSYPYHECDPAEVQQPPPPGSTTGQKFKENYPECFHGADVTNIHYHGTHVSPQPHQDFVLLKLFSENQTDPAPPPESETVAHGSYQTNINPFPWNQAPGTQWYHPHKHGSTALQVLNGMAGALIIQGPFDQWLYGTYGVDPNNDASLEKFEKLLVVQQVWPEMVFFHRPHPNYPPTPLINGQANPVIKMKRGEVQRWRFVGATMQASAQIKVVFPPGYTVKQIAQDGVQFVPENWQRQPLLTGTSGAGFLLAPGNRVDFLVQAPEVGTAGKQSITFELFGHVEDNLRQQLLERSRQKAGALGLSSEQEDALLTVELVNDDDPMQLPCPFGAPGACAQYPAAPYYLRDIGDSEIVRRPTVAFSMTDPATGLATVPGVQPNGFWINKTPYREDCADQTMQLGTAEEWLVTNDSSPQHPFHIHINPFQLVRNDTTSFSPPWVWMDTISLPKVTCQDANAGPLFSQQEAEQKCPGVCAQVSNRSNPPGSFSWNGQWRTVTAGNSVCGCCVGPAVRSVQIRQRFEDYTGGYVIHCHFLGHEDRGMMHNVQTVCPASTPDAWKYGETQTDGSGDDCALTSPVMALPPCPPPTTH